MMTFEEFVKIWQDVPEPAPIFYRLYYDDDGIPVCYTMEDLPGNYIDIDKDAFHKSSSHVQVINGKLVTLSWETTQKITPGKTGVMCHPDDVSIVVNTEPAVKWSKRLYEKS